MQSVFSDTTQFADSLPNDFSYDIPNTLYVIPEDVFEESVCAYFNISTDELRNSIAYHQELGSYIVLDINGRIYPTLLPVISKVSKNEDGNLQIHLIYREIEGRKTVDFGILVVKVENESFKYISFEREYKAQPYL